jgi:hypothetical protein
MYISALRFYDKSSLLPVLPVNYSISRLHHELAGDKSLSKKVGHLEYLTLDTVTSTYIKLIPMSRQSWKISSSLEVASNIHHASIESLAMKRP